MHRRFFVFLIALLVSLNFIYADDYKIKVESGEVVLAKASEKTTVKDSGNIALGDTILIAQEMEATVLIEAGTRLLLTGPLNAVLGGDGFTLKVALEEGQIFLDRNDPQMVSSIQITNKGFSFEPVGTAAAVRASRTSNPSTAVLKGKMKMQSPSGESLVIEEGSFGSVDENGKLTSAKLSPKAVENLQKWAGIADPEPEPAPQASTSEPAAQQKSEPPAPAKEPQTETVKSTPVTPVQPQPQQASSDTKQETSPQQQVKTEQPQKESAEDKKPVESAEKSKEEPADKKPVSPAATAPSKPQWEIGAGTVTIDGDQWTRIALGVDVPIWKFGIFFDLELFIDNEGQFSDKGWNFKEDWVEALTRKIRYIRFGYEQDPLFIKFGGLSNVTLGYGFLFDRFTNMLHYPDQKLLGLQFYLNDIGPIGVTLQTVLADFKDFRNDGGVFGARLAFTPLKMSNIPIVKGISIGGTFAMDINQYAPARDWDFTLSGPINDRDRDGIQDSSFTRYVIQTAGYTFNDSVRQRLLEEGTLYDTLIEDRDQWASRKNVPFSLVGADIGIPLIRSSLLNLDLYGQAGIRTDNVHGWGIGAPGLALKVWQLWANIEYRRVQGRFTPGYFGTYYLDERILRTPEVRPKAERIPSDTLNGIYGRLGFNIANAFIIDGAYQYLIGKRDTDQRFEATASLGDIILQKIPKINKAEAYYYKTDIGNFNDAFFEKTEFMYWGYRAGFEISQGATLIWDSRYGYKRDAEGKLVSNNFISVQTAITF